MALETAQLAEAQRRLADLERERTRAIEDLQVRFLRATGRSAAADDLAFALEQQREYAEAVRAQADAAFLTRLANVQLAEAQLRASEQIQSTIAGLTATIDTLRAFTDSLRLNTQLTSLSPVQQLAEARRQYEAVLARAQGGDQAAAGQLPESARAFLEASRAVNASGGRYQVDFTRVLRESEAVAAMFEAQRTTQEQALDRLRFIGDEIGDVGDWPIEEIADSVAATVAELQTLVRVSVAAADQTTSRLERLEVRLNHIDHTLEGATLR